MNTKRNLISFERVIKTGLVNFVRNAWLAIAAIAVMVITLSIVLFSVIANATFANTINQITERIDVSVYLKDEASSNEVQREELITQIEQLDNVKSVTFISKDQALERYKIQNKENLDLLLAISQTDNPLPASLQIKPDNPDNIEPIRVFLEQTNIKALQAEQTSYSGDRKAAIDKIGTATTFIRRAGVVGVIVFALISMLIIFNTIRMAIFNRRDELTIMRLLGASTWYIRGPFVVETVCYGIISALVSVMLCSIVFSIQSNAFNASTLGLLDIQYASDFFAQHFWAILAIQLTLGILIGAVSSIIATRRYLKFKSSK
jgi:cell division transport system permease protein